jgi:hypothetical protein
MGIIGGLDVHRSQITYDWIDSASGQRQRGQLALSVITKSAAG